MPTLLLVHATKLQISGEYDHKTTNSRCCYNELAVQVNRIEVDIKLLRSLMDIRKAGEDLLRKKLLEKRSSTLSLYSIVC